MQVGSGHPPKITGVTGPSIDLDHYIKQVRAGLAGQEGCLGKAVERKPASLIAAKNTVGLPKSLVRVTTVT